MSPPPPAPPAAGVRAPWEALPATVREAVAEVLRAPVVTAVTQPGGFSPGVAARVTAAGGHRAFVKAVSADVNPDSPNIHRAEARNTAALPPGVPAPRLLGTHDDGTWVALVLEDVPGRQPQVPWKDDELTLVLDAVAALGRALAAAPAAFDAPPLTESLTDTFSGWHRLLHGTDKTDSSEHDDHNAHRHRLDRLAELDPWAARNLRLLVELSATWRDAAGGDSLAHCDLRADNILLTPAGGAVFVDWPHVRSAAAPWFDLLLMLPSVRAQGGPDPEEVFTAHPLGRSADPAGVTATLAALAGYFVASALEPPPPGLPTLRPFQRAQGEAALEWLRRRLGTPPGAHPGTRLR
ncbi:hypothetical protein SGFS_091680 [Streptomyces graminofaciens]|uniref:Aminoglycoside phosphotransferase n=1 Tax=Streptomyces graminofaciens TaxID=68212 RepID=A0ABM7FJ50_9ACTN|nr:phosphotransferase [Streptomyces graminofaciens]BBC37874.1 hypothetical protein SGFS_091680 [Streptomyces graminofaciens]